MQILVIYHSNIGQLLLVIKIYFCIFALEESMNFIENKVGDVFILEVNLPRTSIYAANEFKESLNKIIDDGEKKLIVDFSKCDFVDSTFLGVLVIGLKKLTPAGGGLRLVITHPNVKSSLELTRMDKIFKIFGDLDTAINSYSE